MPGTLKKLAIGVSKPILKIIATSDFGWRYLQTPLARCVAYMQRYHDDMHFPASVIEEQRRAEADIAKQLIVRRGPFAGMKYPSVARLGSACLPKLLGVYEQELHPILGKLKDRNYTDILNVGCAEGYYAVGLAMLYPTATVMAYDIDSRQTAFCADLAALNGVGERVKTKAACTPQTLATFPFTGRGLVLCDCEGYERELFTESAVSNLGNCDVLVELHDHIDLTITDRLVKLFEATHTPTFIESVDTVKRAKTFNVPELEGTDLEVRRRILVERFVPMEWAFFEPRAEV